MHSIGCSYSRKTLSVILNFDVAALTRTTRIGQRFVETLGEACAETGWQVQACVLMPNHFHLVVETPQPNLVAGMTWFLGTYTSRFNRWHKLFGHLFSGSPERKQRLSTRLPFRLRRRTVECPSAAWPNCFLFA